MNKCIDIGANLTDEMYQGIYRGKQCHPSDLDVVLDRGWDQGLQKLIVTSGLLSESTKAIKMISDDDRLYTTVGVHPTRCNVFEEEGNDPDNYLQQLMQCALDNKSKVVAVGEFGLDYDRLHFCSKEVQKKYFRHQFKLSAATGLPLFLHLRNAATDFFEIVHDMRGSFKHGVVHSFDGTSDELAKLLEFGFYIGVNGCSLKTEENLKVVSEIPLDRLMIETDAPWCGIRPSHKSSTFVKTKFPEKKKEKWDKTCCVKGRSEPCHIRQVLEVVSGLHSVGVEQAAEQIYNNTCRVFFPKPQKDI